MGLPQLPTTGTSVENRRKQLYSALLVLRFRGASHLLVALFCNRRCTARDEGASSPPAAHHVQLPESRVICAWFSEACNNINIVSRSINPSGTVTPAHLTGPRTA
jgi:hypothetical protein